MARKTLGAAHRKAYLKRWYRKNRKRILAKQKEHAARNLELQRQWVAANQELVRERRRIYWSDPANRERKNARARARRAALRSIRLTTVS
jgi:outer membrane lipopolysaccharide assembly protein LptE/RlpB